MSQGPPTRPLPTSSEEPRLRFNWPPSEDELAQYGAENLRSDSEFEEAGFEAGELPPIDASPATETISQYPSETRAPRLAAFPPDASPPSDSGLALLGGPPAALFPLPEQEHDPEPEPFRATSSSAPESWTPVDGAQTPSDDGDFQHSWSEATSASGIAASPGAAAVDPSGTGGFADEIAHLQALIEGLTHKIEWRIPDVAGR
jgi:hypothetical protein